MIQSCENSQVSNRATTAFVLGILSLVLCSFVTGIPAIILGRAELVAIREGWASPSGRVMAKAGLITGFIGSILFPALAFLALVVIPSCINILAG